MKVAYFDCFAGISGDMTVGALLDLGLDLTVLEQELQKLPLDGYRLEAVTVDKRGIQATQFRVLLAGPDGEQLADAEFQEVSPGGHSADQEKGAPQHHHHQHLSNQETHHSHRSLAEILALINHSCLSQKVKSTAGAIFTRLGQAEANVHGMPLEEVHFHEVGGIDAIVDIVRVAIGLEALGLERIYASP
jgi:hypothetical protein